MSNQLKILRFFVEHRNEAFTVKKVAEALEINYRIAYDEIRSLEKEQLLKITKLGNSNQCKFNYQFHEKIVAVENIRKKGYKIGSRIAHKVTADALIVFVRDKQDT